MQQSTPSLWYHLSQVPPSSLPRHACSNWKELAKRMSTLGIPSSRSKLFTPTHLTFTPHVGVTIILTELSHLNFLAWTPNSFNWVYWEIRRCASSGDVRPPDLPLSNTTTTPTWRQPTMCFLRRQPIMCIAERHSSKRRPCTLLNHPSFSIHVSCWTRHHRSSHPVTWSVHKPPILELWFDQRKD